MRTIVLLAFLVLLFGCLGEDLTSVSELQKDPEKYLGEKVIVKGMVKNSFKIGKLSGFKLEDTGETITVLSDSLPAEGGEVTVEGTFMHQIFVGHYLLAKDIRMS